MTLRDEIERYIRVIACEIECDVVCVNIKNGKFFSSMSFDGLRSGNPVETHRVDDTLCSISLYANSPVSIEDAPSDENFSAIPYVANGMISGYLGVPINVREIGPVGTVCAINQKPRIWLAREHDLLQAMALAIGMAIELEMLRFEADTLSDGLHETDALLVVMAECLDQPIAIIDRQYNVTFISRQLEARLGMEAVSAAAEALILQFSKLCENADGRENQIECEHAGQTVAISYTSSGSYFCKWDLKSQRMV